MQSEVQVSPDKRNKTHYLTPKYRKGERGGQKKKTKTCEFGLLRSQDKWDCPNYIKFEQLAKLLFLKNNNNEIPYII